MSKAMNNFMACECDFDTAEIVLFSAPFDGTTSFRPGARFAGQAIRGDSYGIESYSPYQEKDLYDMKIHDAGEEELPYGNPKRMYEIIMAQATEILGAGKKSLMLGGEHLVSLGAIQAAARKFPDLHILHLDAHADLRDEYLGERFSHATVMRRAWEIVGDKRIYQLGIRSGDAAEFQFAAEHTVMSKFSLKRVENFVRALEGRAVYLSLDLDVLDSAFFPGTGTPEPGGVSFRELHEAILALKGLNIVAADIVELAPHYDPSGASTAAACKITREILMLMGSCG